MSKDTTSTSTLGIREKLRSHFQSHTGPSEGSGWSKLWEQGFLPWDKGTPNPALIDTLRAHRQDLLSNPSTNSPTSSGKSVSRPRALVPGCGKGYDVLLLASAGYDAVGLEVSEVAIQQAEAVAKEQATKYPVFDEEVGRGSVKFVRGDFFQDEWQAAAGGGVYDLIYDYTVRHLLFFLRTFNGVTHAHLQHGPCVVGRAATCSEDRPLA